MRVSELSGKQLDFWVAKALGWNPDAFTMGGIDEIPANPGLPYSRDWSLGGRIIESDRIAIYFDGAEWRAGFDLAAGDGPGIYMDRAQWGATPLLAAMRAFVTSKFGDEVS